MNVFRAATNLISKIIKIIIKTITNRKIQNNITRLLNRECRGLAELKQ